MHPAAYYALNIGSKIEKPKIYLKYQPIPYKKFILINLKNNLYKYWQEVIDLILSDLKKYEYEIIQIIENENEGLKNVSHFIDNKNFNLNGYICSQSSLYVGEPTIEMHMCGIFNKKIISIYSDGEVDNIKPYWSESEDVNFFKINDNLWPETISKNILKFLNIKNEINFQTHYIGSDFCNKKVEIIPSEGFNFGPISQINNQIVRMDINFHEAFLNEFLSLKKSIIFTKKSINFNILKNRSENIINIIYILEKNYDFNFIKNMRSLGINYTFISYEDDDFIKNLKYELMDYGPIVKKDISKTNKKFKLNKNLYFRTCRVLYNGSNFYSSEYNYYNNMPRKPLEQIHDDPKFWESIEDFYIFSLD
jgi:hypothetical protein